MLFLVVFLFLFLFLFLNTTPVNMMNITGVASPEINL